MNTYLQPFCKKLQDCFNDGVNWINPKTNESRKSQNVIFCISVLHGASATINGATILDLRLSLVHTLMDVMAVIFAKLKLKSVE